MNDDTARDTETIRSIAAAEARRVLSGAQIEANPARVAEGWERRFIADGARADEMMRLYEELGYEVLAEPIELDHIGDDCEGCRLVVLLQFRMIYTRRPQSPRV